MLKSIYLCNEWGKIQEPKEKGKSEIFRFEDKIEYSYIKRYAGTADGVDYYDLVTPRGEGGPIFLTEPSAQSVLGFEYEFDRFCRENNIVAEYIRFDPWNTDASLFGEIYNISPHGFAYTQRLQEDFFFTQYNTKRRNQIRKAQSYGIEIKTDESWDKIDSFIELYEYTVSKHSVGDYYLFDKDFLMSYRDTFGKRAKLGFAYYNEIPIATGIFLNGGDIYHYHFSASHPEYVSLNAISLLLMEEAKLGAEEGCRYFDLGGATPGSGLEHFKKSMVKADGIIPCFCGTKIRNTEIYSKLIEINGKAKDGYFPEYIRIYPD